MFRKSFLGQIMFIIAILALSVGHVMRVLDGSNIRPVQVISLLGNGMLLGALLTRVMIHFKQRNSA